MKTLFGIIFVILIFNSLICISSCSNSKIRVDKIAFDDRDSLIVLVNIDDLDREGIANLIEAVHECNPRALGLNIIFSEIGNPPNHADTLLAAAINMSDVIVLVENIGEGTSQRTTSDPFFKPVNDGNRIDTGMLLYAFDDEDQVNYYTPLYEDGLGQSPAFPLLLAITYDIYSYGRFQFDNHVGINRPKEIQYVLPMDNLTMLNSNNVPCSSIFGKIVILGYLGPRKENTRDTPLGPETYSTVIVANILHNILDTKRKD